MFVSGTEYLRQSLLDFVGSRQLQSGMIYGSKEPDCIIITTGGKHGKDAGYSDERNNDGSWFYIAQGSKGDQIPDSTINSYLTNGEKTVLLFSTREPNSEEVKKRNGSRKKLYRFEGIFEVGFWNYYIPTAGKRKGDKLVRCCLIPAENIFNLDNNISTLSIDTNSLIELRKIIINNGEKPSKQTLSIVECKRRNLLVKKYALGRAKGICESCNAQAPFTDIAGVPFLEVHHIKRLSDDGLDNPLNVAAVCPNCHRAAHYRLNKSEIKDHLIIIISEKESKMDQEMFL